MSLLTQKFETMLVQQPQSAIHDYEETQASQSYFPKA